MHIYIYIERERYREIHSQESLQHTAGFQLNVGMNSQESLQSIADSYVNVEHKRLATYYCGLLVQR